MNNAPSWKTARIADTWRFREFGATALATRLNAHKTSRGWIGRCPAHDDRRASLSVAEGREDRILLRCFAGCSVERIVAALGLSLSDLFARDCPRDDRLCDRRPPTIRDLREALEREADRYRKNNRIDSSQPLLTAEVNKIRERVALRYNVALEPRPASLYEGGYGGRERDPLWPLVFEQAWRDVWIEHAGVVPLSLADHVRHELRPASMLFIASEDRAALQMRTMERAARARTPRE